MELKNVPKTGIELNLATKLVLGTFVTACIALLFLGITNLLPTDKSTASGTGTSYSISGNSNSSTNMTLYSNLQSGDTLVVEVGQKWTIRDDLDLSSIDLVIILHGEMHFFDAYSVYFSANSEIYRTAGGRIRENGARAHTDMAIFFGGVRTISYDGVGATYSFDDFNSSQGYNSSGLVLPVSLIAFDADLLDQHVHLTWSTAQEDNNSHFEVQRSLNGEDFETLETVKGFGNSTERIDYQYDDMMLPSSANALFYRLKQVDFDGEFEIFEPVVVRTNLVVNKGKVFPNPATTHVDVTKSEEEPFLASLIDQTGALITTENSIDGKVRFNTNELPNGIYFVSIETEGNPVESHRLIVQH